MDAVDEAGMACDRGCFVCGPSGQRQRHNGTTGCCNSTMCNTHRWRDQTIWWLSVEEKFNYALWLEVEKTTQEEWAAAEEVFREELRSTPKVHIKQVPRPPNNPARTREIAAAQRQRATAQGRAQ